MSHRKERKENDCLNCGAVVYGKFCHICGQENIEPKESFWNLFTHFVYDITHFDGKFFSTVKLLILKPGFLSREYINGRRNSYLNPIRMYVFTSAFFFIFFFSVYKTDNYVKGDGKKATAAEVIKSLQKKKVKLEEKLSDASILPTVKKGLLAEYAVLQGDLLLISRDSTKVDSVKTTKDNLLVTIGGKSANFKTLEAYDSAQLALHPNKRDGWVNNILNKKNIELQAKYGNDGRTFLKIVFDKFMHTFPQLLFISLPVFALMLKLIYFRRKNFYYGDHGIYAVHVYCAMFIIIFVQMILSKLEALPSFDWISFPLAVSFIYMFWYIYKSMRNFYQQSRLKTILKYFFLFWIYTMMMTLLFIIFFTISIFTIK